MNEKCVQVSVKKTQKQIEMSADVPKKHPVFTPEKCVEMSPGFLLNNCPLMTFLKIGFDASKMERDVSRSL